MQKGANFCATLLLLYHTSDWLNQQTLPKLQIAVYMFIRNWSTTFFSTKRLPSLYHSNPMWGTLENWKLFVFVYDHCDWLNVLTQRKLPFKIEFKYILFHKPAFHWVIHSLYENQLFQCGESVLPQKYRKCDSSYLDHYLMLNACYRRRTVFYFCFILIVTFRVNDMK